MSIELVFDPSVSEFLPPHARMSLIEAARRGDRDRIDQLTDLIALSYPELVRPRADVREGYESATRAFPTVE